MEIRDIVTANGTAQGIAIPLPNATLILITARQGYLMCGYLNLAAAEKMGDRAAIISGVKTIDDMLSGEVKEVTSRARKAGIRPKMTGQQALAKLF